MLAMGKHRRDDVGVVYLAASESIVQAQLAQRVPNHRAVLEHVEATGECCGIGHCDREAERLSPCLPPSDYREIFAQDLPAECRSLLARDTDEGSTGSVLKR